MVRYKYIFSLLLLFISFSFSFGQDNDTLFAPVKVKEPLVFKGIKLGVNVGRFSDYLFKPDRFSYEGSIDFNISHKYYGVIEAGYSELTREEDNYTYYSDGYFYKVGLDFNMLKKHPTDYLGMGFRVGRADFSHSADNVLIEDARWGTSLESISIDSKSYNTYWLEVSFGLKGELLKNVYFGWSALVRVGISGRKDNEFQPIDIPGFGKGANTVNLGANYYIYYQIPFNRK